MNFRLLLPALAAASLLVTSAFAQGVLTPSSSPAATMKSLDQIEARTPIGTVGGSTSTIYITTPGSYVLMGNVTVSSGDGIDIYTSGVTLDLNGFTVTSTASTAAGYGILASNSTSNITIRNGHIRGQTTYDSATATYTTGGFLYGVYFYSSENVLVENVSVRGVAQYGIYCYTGYTKATIRACSAHVCGNIGLSATEVIDSVAETCGGNAIYAAVAANCQGSSTAAGYGLFASAATNCRGFSASNFGLYANTAISCYGSSTSGYGLYASSTANNCYGVSSSNTGIFTATATSCYGNSTSGTGLQATTAVGCYGYSDTGAGLSASSASGCRGYSANSSSTGIGISAMVAENCYGTAAGSSYGIYTTLANNCYGASSTGTGLYAYGNASNCFGFTTSATNYGIQVNGTASYCRAGNSSGTAISAGIAVGCTAQSGTISATNKYLMP